MTTIVRFSEEERALLRDPEKSKHFRREVEGALHVCVPESFPRDSPNANTRTWDPVLWRPIQYSGLGAAKDLRRSAHGGRKKESGIASRTDRAVCVSLDLFLPLSFLLTQFLLEQSSPPGASPAAGSRPARATLKHCALTTSAFPQLLSRRILTCATRRSEQTTLETAEIARITPTGVVLRDGRTNKLDVLVCATGFDTTFRYPFRVLGRGGQALSERWAATAGGPEAYLSLAVDGFPNLFVCGGPNSAVNSGSLVTIGEHVVKYIVEAVRKMQRERLRSMEVRREAMEDWSAYVRVSGAGKVSLCSSAKVFWAYCADWGLLAKGYFPRVCRAF